VKAKILGRGAILSGIAALVLASGSAAALASTSGSGPASAQTTVSGNVAEVIGWETPPPSTFSLGSLLPGQLSTPQDIPWAVSSNDGNGTQMDLSIQNNGAVLGAGSFNGPEPFTGANAAQDNQQYIGLLDQAAQGGDPGLTLALPDATTAVNYGWNIDGQQGVVPQSGSYTEATIAGGDTSTHNTAVAFLTPQSVFPDTVSATFTFTLVGQ
jgi:hypothetical protein